MSVIVSMSSACLQGYPDPFRLGGPGQMCNDCGTSMAHMHISRHMHMPVSRKKNVGDELMFFVKCNVRMLCAIYLSISSFERSQCFPLCSSVSGFL